MGPPVHMRPIKRETPEGIDYLTSDPEAGMSILASTVAICLKTFLLTLTSRVSTEGPPALEDYVMITLYSWGMIKKKSN